MCYANAMRPSANRHVVALLRGVIGLNQTDFSEVADCSASTIQAIELERLKLSDALATKIAVATRVSKRWLLANDLKVPPVNSFNEPYRKEDYENAQSEKLDDIEPRFFGYTALIYYARLRSVASAASKKGWHEYKLALYKIDAVLTELQNTFGFDDSIYPGTPDVMKAIDVVLRDAEEVGSAFVKSASEVGQLTENAPVVAISEEGKHSIININHRLRTGPTQSGKKSSGAQRGSVSKVRAQPSDER